MDKPGRIKSVGESMTQQHMANDTDINTIIKRAQRGIPLPVSRLQPLYGDFSEIGDYREALQRIKDAQEAFNTLPADVRLRFGNDPGSIIEFLQDEGNKEEAEALGLIEKKEIPERSVPGETGSGNGQQIGNDDNAKSVPKASKKAAKSAASEEDTQ